MLIEEADKEDVIGIGLSHVDVLNVCDWDRAARALMIDVVSTD